MTSHPLLVLNPGAGSKRKSRNLGRLILKLRSVFPDLETVSTDERNDGTKLARESLKKDFPLVICAGGDGTINEVINGLAGSGTDLAILPTGTGNALAREIGLPLNALKACDYISASKPAALPLGRVNGRYFVLLAGVGFDAFIIQQVSSRLKRNFGIFAYLVAGFISLFKYPYPTIRFKIQDRVITGTCAFFFKARCPIGPFTLAPQAGLYEPWLDLYIYKGRGAVNYLRYILAVLLGRQSKLPDVEYQKVKEATVISDGPVAVHTDGETIEPASCYRIGIASERISLLVP